MQIVLDFILFLLVAVVKQQIDFAVGYVLEVDVVEAVETVVEVGVNIEADELGIQSSVFLHQGRDAIIAIAQFHHELVEFLNSSWTFGEESVDVNFQIIRLEWSC